MPQKDHRPGERYLHFKNRIYQIIAIAQHSETGEKMVVYQALYGGFETYVRPLEMFVSLVDNEKYPQVKQRYRFQWMEPETEAMPSWENESEVEAMSFQKNEPEAGVVSFQGNEPETEAVSFRGNEFETEAVSSQENELEADAMLSRENELEADTMLFRENELETDSLPSREEESGEEISKEKSVSKKQVSIEDKMIAFFEADTMEQRYKILLDMQDKVTNRMINNMAVFLDVVIEEGPLDLRYEDLKACLRTLQRYECSRLR